jgi:hypothetical protein
VNQIQLAIYRPLCIDVQLASTAPGAHLQAYPCGPGKLSQEWTIKPATANGSLISKGLWMVVNANSKMCMTVSPTPDTAPGQYVLQEPCSPDASDPDQIWTIKDAPDGEEGVRFMSVASQQCLDLPYGAAASIFTLQQYYCTPNDPAQGWVIHGVSRGTIP